MVYTNKQLVGITAIVLLTSSWCSYSFGYANGVFDSRKEMEPKIQASKACDFEMVQAGKMTKFAGEVYLIKSFSYETYSYLPSTLHIQLEKVQNNQ